VLAHRPFRTARVARQHSLGDFGVITQLLTQPGSSRIRLYLQPQQMNLHRRQNARQLRIAAELRQRVVEVASLVDIVDIRALAILVDFQPLVGLADPLPVPAPAGRFRGEPGHKSRQDLEYDEGLISLRARERANVGTTMARQCNDALYRQSLERFPHRCTIQIKLV